MRKQKHDEKHYKFSMKFFICPDLVILSEIMIFQTVFTYTRNKLHKLVKNFQQCAVTLCIVAKHRERETLKEEYVSKSNQDLNFRSHSMFFFTVIQPSTVEPDDSKPVDSKLQELENFLLLTKISNHSINHIIDSKHLAIVNIFAPLKKFTKARFDCNRKFIIDAS